MRSTAAALTVEASPRGPIFVASGALIVIQSMMFSLSSLISFVFFAAGTSTTMATPSIAAPGEQREPYQQTTLEQAFSRAYNVKVADGTWASILGSIEEVEADSYCTGDFDSWPLPPRSSNNNTQNENEMDDLERVLLSGTFVCGWVENLLYTSSAGQVLIESDDTSVSGATADWWNALVTEVSESYNTSISLEWKLFPTSQATLTALHRGEIDAACGYWHASGVWEPELAAESPPTSLPPPVNETVGTNTTQPSLNSSAQVAAIARGLAFSFHTCPTAMIRDYIFTPIASGIATFESLLAAIQQDEVTQICVSGAGGTVHSCQSTMDQAMKAATMASNDTSTSLAVVKCLQNNTSTASFASMEAGDCGAVWSGYPPSNDGTTNDNVVSLYNVFTQPRLVARGTYFRSANLNARNSSTTTTTTTSDNIPPPSNDTTSQAEEEAIPNIGPRYHERTTLEQAFTRAFNLLVHDGTYAESIAGFKNVDAASFCTGDFESWPLPPAPSITAASLEDDDSDLAAVLKRGAFRCGYTSNYVVASSPEEVYVNATNDNAYGALSEFWKKHLIPTLGRLYGVDDLRVEWVMQDFAVGTLNDLYEGRVDAACLYWWPSGVWVLEGTKVARPLAFSPFYCPAFLQVDNVYTLADSNIKSWNQLVAQAKDYEVQRICVSDDVTGGGVVTCQTAIDEYTQNLPHVPCDGSTLANDETHSETAFRRLNENQCQTAWSGIPPDSLENYNVFRQPTLIAPVAFFRTFDAALRMDPSTGSPIPSPVNPPITPPTEGPEDNNLNTFRPTPVPTPIPTSGTDPAPFLTLLTTSAFVPAALSLVVIMLRF